MSLPRLYAILDTDIVSRRGLVPFDVLRAWLDAGVTLVQLRAKSLSFGPMLELAQPMAAECRKAGAQFIVNDRADVAALVEADGVHLGQTDLGPDDVRKVMPQARWIGLSTHSDAQIDAGLASSATYLAFGPVFPTQSKANPDPVVGLEGVARAATRVRDRGRPLVAIGGIRLENASSVIGAGASSVAVISDLLSGDVAGRARAFLRAVGS